MNIQIFGKSKCFDTKKAERWFKERRIKYQYIDLLKYGISRGELTSVRAAVGFDALLDEKAGDYALLQYLAHDDKFQQNFQVPFMVLSSDDKAHKVIKAQRSANDFLSFFSQWTGIQAAEITPRYRFISEQKAGPVYITNFQLQKVDYAHLGTDEFTVN